METLITVLTLTSGISWTIVYLTIIYRGFKDKTCGMPFFALALNIAWEFIFSFLFGGGFSLQLVILDFGHFCKTLYNQLFLTEKLALLKAG